MIWRIGLASFLLLCTSLATAHEPVLLDARRATPGLRLELVEVPSATTPNSITARYRLRVSGMPPGVVFSVWTKDFGQFFHEVAAGLRMDESGVIVSSEPDGVGRPRRLDETALDPGPNYLPGAVWEVALASIDLTLTAFAKVIPHPLTLGMDHVPSLWILSHASATASSLPGLALRLTRTSSPRYSMRER